MKLHSVYTNPMATTRTGIGHAQKTTDYTWTNYDLTLGFQRVPVFGGKENETSLLPVVRIRSRKGSDPETICIPLSNVVDWVVLEEKHEKAALDKSRHTVAGRVA